MACQPISRLWPNACSSHVLGVGCIGLLLSLLVPAVMKAREDARRTQCKMALRRSLAMSDFAADDEGNSASGDVVWSAVVGTTAFRNASFQRLACESTIALEPERFEKRQLRLPQSKGRTDRCVKQKNHGSVVAHNQITGSHEAMVMCQRISRPSQLSHRLLEQRQTCGVAARRTSAGRSTWRSP